MNQNNIQTDSEKTTKKRKKEKRGKKNINR